MTPSDHNTRFEVIEFYSTPEGYHDDRMLCTDGLFYRPEEQHPPVAKFPSEDTAQASGNDATNKRDGALIVALPIEPAPAWSTMLQLTAPNWDAYGVRNPKR